MFILCGVIGCGGLRGSLSFVFYYLRRQWREVCELLVLLGLGLGWRLGVALFFLVVVQRWVRMVEQRLVEQRKDD